MKRMNVLCLFALCVTLLYACLLCSVAAAEINWTTEMPKGRYLTRSQYSYRTKNGSVWSEWSEWRDGRFDTTPTRYDEYKTRILYAESDGIFMIGTMDEITMLKGTGAQMAYSVDDDSYWTSPYWTSTDESIVSVDQKGYVSAHKAGTATIEVHYYKMSTSSTWLTQSVQVVVISQGGLKLPSAVSTVSEQAFYGDDAFSMVDLRGTSVDYIGEKAFADDDMLRLLMADGGDISVEDNAFDGSDHVTFAVTGLGGLSEYAIQKGLPCYCLGEEKPIEFYPVTSIGFGAGYFDLEVGKSTVLHPEVFPRYASNKVLAYSSSAPEIASVSSDGIVTGVRGGEAIITVSSTDGSNKQTTYKVLIRQKVTSITLDVTSLTLNLYDHYVVTATVWPSDATDPSVRYYSDNENVATANLEGYVYARGVGTTVIRCRAQDQSNVEATFTVTVTDANQPKYTSIWSSEIQATNAKINASVHLPTGNPEYCGYYLGTSPDALYKRETESCSGLTYTIENIFYTCTGLSPSTTYYYRFFMTYNSLDRYSDIGSFTTAAAAPVNVSIAGTSSECWVNVNQDISLPYTVSPSNAYVSWSSSNSSLCSVDQSGKIYPRGKGTVTITATASLNGVTGTYSWTIHII